MDVEFYIVINHQHHPKNHYPVGDFYDGAFVFWGKGAERKAKAVAKKLNPVLPGFHFATVESVATA